MRELGAQFQQLAGSGVLTSSPANSFPPFEVRKVNLNTGNCSPGSDTGKPSTFASVYHLTRKGMS